MKAMPQGTKVTKSSIDDYTARKDAWRLTPHGRVYTAIVDLQDLEKTKIALSLLDNINELVPEAEFQYCDRHRPALCWAVVFHAHDITEYLMSLPEVDPNAVDNKGHSPLHYICSDFEVHAPTKRRDGTSTGGSAAHPFMTLDTKLINLFANHPRVDFNIHSQVNTEAAELRFSRGPLWELYRREFRFNIMVRFIASGKHIDVHSRGLAIASGPGYTVKTLQEFYRECEGETVSQWLDRYAEDKEKTIQDAKDWLAQEAADIAAHTPRWSVSIGYGQRTGQQIAN